MQPHLFESMARDECRHWWFAGKRRLILAVLRRQGVAAGARVLDLGCGTGATLEALGHRYTATGMETNAQALEWCRRRRLRVVPGSFPGPLPNELGTEVDAVVLADVIEHLDDDAGALRDAAGLLRPGGILVVTVPAHPWMWTAHDVSLHHRRRYTKHMLRGAAEQAELSVRLMSWANVASFPLMAAQRAVMRLTGAGPQPGSAPVPPKPINALLRAAFSLESRTAGRVPHPFGGSLLAVLVRAATEPGDGTEGEPDANDPSPPKRTRVG